MKPRKTLLTTCSLVATFTMATTILNAASGTWTGLTSSTWQVNGNWTGATFPSGSGETATFDGAGNGITNITLGGGSITLGASGVNGIVFDTASVAGYSITNGTINTARGNSGGTAVLLSPTVVNSQSVTADIVTDSGGTSGSEFVINNSPTARLTLGALSTAPAASTNSSLIYAFRGLGDVTVGGAITNNTSLGAQRLTAVSNHRAGTLVLSGANNFSGINDSTTDQNNISSGLGGTVVLDYTVGNTVLASGISVSPGRNANGNLVIEGNTSGATTVALSATQRFAGGYTTIKVDNNGGSGTTLSLGSNWRAWNSNNAGRMVNFDLSGGGSVLVSGGLSSASSAYYVDRGIIGQGGTRRAAATVTGTDGKTYFATLNGSNYVAAQTTQTALTAGAANNFSTIYEATSNLTMNSSGGTFGLLALRIEGASANQTLNMNTRGMDMGGAILMDGSQNFTISNFSNLQTGSGIIVMGSGKLVLDGTRASGASGSIQKYGPGLLEVTGNFSASITETSIWGGTYRASSANALTGGSLSLADGVLEVGYDFTRALGTGNGQVYARVDAFDATQGSSMGFSAYGADRTVNLGGAGATMTFGGTNFVGTRDAKFLLSSTNSDSMVDFQNPLNLNNDVQTIEVRNGSAAIDARLSGILSNGSLNKTGAGTLELTAANTYAGTTVVAGGKLVVTDSIASSAVLVTNAGSTLATDTAANIGSSLTIGNGAILAVGDAANATTATATVGGATTLHNGSIFSWDINAAGTGYDKLVTTSLAGEAAAGDAVFRIVASDALVAANFWNTTKTWTDIFTTDGTDPIGMWATLFGNTVSVVNSSFAPLNTSTYGTFSISGSTLTWTAVPEPTSALAGLLITAGLLRRRCR